MFPAQCKQELPLAILRFSLRIKSLFFQKLVLLQKDQYLNPHVGHYDYACQGLEILTSFYKKKFQATLIKSFDKIREGRGENEAQQQISERKHKGFTKRTYIHSNRSTSEQSPMKDVQFFSSRNTKSSRQISNGYRDQNNQTFDGLQNLLRRVKEVNNQSRSQLNTSFNTFGSVTALNKAVTSQASLGGVYNRDRKLDDSNVVKFKTNPSCTDSRSDLNITARSKLSKHLKRQEIFQKFRNIETRLKQIQDEDENVEENNVKHEISILRHIMNKRYGNKVN